MSDRRSVGRSRWWAWIVAGAVLAIFAVAAGAWSLIDPMSISNDVDRGRAIQTVFTIGFGFGGLATLGLITRRQWLQEPIHEHDRHVAADARHDAEERRITEQYIQAVEQLGHDKAPVRLGGLYGLDRLGRDHRGQREKIAEVWCAYLRRRYTPPADLLGHSNPGSVVDGKSGHTGARIQAESEAADEYEVRMTVQRLLEEHLKDPRPITERDEMRPTESDEYWHLKQLNLTGATLIGANFTGCRIPTLNAAHARFRDETRFTQAHFEGNADFTDSLFSGDAEFGRAYFDGESTFDSVRFAGDASFEHVIFGNMVWLIQAHFESYVSFNGAHFDGDVKCIRTHFDSQALFGSEPFRAR